MTRLSVSQRLRNKLEDELDIHLPTAPQRIWGESSGSCRWFVTDDSGVEYLSYYPMSDCVRRNVKLTVNGSSSEPRKKFIAPQITEDIK